MPAITYSKFDVGLDLRKGASVSDANRLRQLKNAYVTTGQVVRKRPGLTKVATLEGGTKGLVAGNNVLNTFYESGSITHANTLFKANQVAHPSTSEAVKKIHYGDLFNGYLYVAVEYDDGSTYHHYLDGSSPSYVSDANCPHSKGVIKMASKIWAVAGDVVRFSATNLPRNWTLADDAGFLPSGLQQGGADNARALGQQDRDLVVFFDTAAQVWVPDPDPRLHTFRKPIRGVGTRYPRSVANVSDDSFFLSDAGYRSIAVRGQDANLQDFDVGSPIDEVVSPLLPPTADPISIYHAGGGQYLCQVDSQVHVFTFSRSAKISAWSVYEFGITFDDFAELNGVLYLRSGDDVYKLDDTVFTDDGAQYEMVVELPYLDLKKPGVLKQIIGVDAVIQGSADIQLRWDPRDTARITDKVPLSGDTYSGALTPLECTAERFAPVITATNTQEVQIDALTFYYNELGVL